MVTASAGRGLVGTEYPRIAGELRALKIVPHICWILCYNIAVHLKVEGPKKPSRGTIGNDADLLAGNLRWSYGDESVNPLGRRAVVAGAIQPAGK